MNFLRKRVFVAYGLLLVFLAGFPGAWIGGKIFPARRVTTPIDSGVLSQATITIYLAHAIVIAFVIFLHTRRADGAILEQRPRSWLVFTYGAYAIGLAVGIVVSGVMR